MFPIWLLTGMSLQRFQIEQGFISQFRGLLIYKAPCSAPNEAREAHLGLKAFQTDDVLVG